MKRLVWTLVVFACPGCAAQPAPLDVNAGDALVAQRDAAESEDAPSDAAHLAEAPCRLPLPPDAIEGDTVLCMDLHTRADPAQAEPQVRVHVVLFDPNLAPPPVLVLQGGPGLLGASYIPYLTEEVRRARFGARPVVYVEQRGVGVSEPALRCPPPLSIASCLEGLRSSGISPEWFSTAHAARDLAAVITLLGRGPVLLAAGSYGSRLGLELLRVAPEQVSAAYLESLVPPDTAYLEAFASGTAEALDALAAACTDDPACAALHPDPSAEIDAAFARAERAPLSTAYGPLDPTLLTLSIVIAQYHRDLLGSILWGIGATARGEPDAITFAESALVRADAVEGLLNQVVLCLDVAPLFDQARYAVRLERAIAPMRPTLGGFAASLTSCGALGIGAGEAASREPVRYEGPVLLVAHALDGRTPRENLLRVQATLPAARALDVPLRTHTAGLGLQDMERPSDRCAASLIAAFLDAPSAEPDTSCIDDPRVIDWR